MPKTIYRVLIPENPQELIVLGEAVIAKHTADGVNSPLTFMDMAAFEDIVADAKAQDILSTQYNAQKESAYQERDVALGINANVTGTVDYYVKSSRDILAGYYKNHEDKLNFWGFEVSAGKDQMKINIPTAPDKMIELGTAILAKNTLEGANSPIKGLDIVDFTAKLGTASAQHALAIEYKGKKEVATADRDKFLGIAANQKLSTEGTVRFFVIAIRDVLLGLYKNVEQNLELWGYSVSIGPKPPSGKKSLTGKITDTQNYPLNGVKVTIVETGVSANTSSEGIYYFVKLVAGIYTVEASKNGYQTQLIPGVEIKNDEEKIVNMQLLVTLSSLMANVTHEGQPVNEAIVSIPLLGLSAPTNPQGQATLNGITPGTWEVTVSATGYQSQSTPVTFEPNMIASAFFELVPA